MSHTIGVLLVSLDRIHSQDHQLARRAQFGHNNYSIGSKESLAVEVNHMIRGIRHPDSCLPCDLFEILQEVPTIQESRHEYQACLAAGKQSFQLRQALRVHWAVASYCLNEDEPILFIEMHDHVGHLPVLLDNNAEV